MAVIQRKALLARLSELGERIQCAWREAHPAGRCEQSAFPAVARRALEEAALERAFDLDEVIDGVAAAVSLPEQNLLDESFGQPPLTVFRGDGFVVELLFWVDGLVTIHQHAFNGAFSVFHGSSVHSRYRFGETKRRGDSLLVGDLAWTESELLQRGDVREIRAGRGLIHATFHLDRPTVSLVVRTDRDPEGLPQYDFRPPCLAVDPFAGRPLLPKRLGMLRMVHRSRREAYLRTAKTMLSGADWLTTYAILDQAYKLDQPDASAGAGDSERARVVALAREALGPGIDELLPVLEANAARRSLVARRDAVTDDDELRFFLAVLLTVPDREALLRLVRERFPARDPVDVVLRALAVLGFDPDALVVSRALVAGEGTREALKARLARENVRFDNDYAMLRAVQTLRATPGFAALLT